MCKTVRMADIAKELGISVVSVSKALAGKPGVSNETRAKVVDLARQMGYEYPVSGGDSAGTGNIGVLVSDRFFSENAFYTSLYRSLVLNSGNEGFTCIVELVTQEAEQSASLSPLITNRKVDGIIFLGNLPLDYLHAAEETGIPCLRLDFYQPGISSNDYVISDNLDGGYTLTEHLLRQGRRAIGFVGSIRATSSIMDRYLGYQKALRLAGLIPHEEWLLEDRDENGNFIPLCLPETLPEAFLCSCDEVAYNLVQTLQRAGKQVPEDVAVCGYDDFHFATLCQPPLTTYHVNAEQMAIAAIYHLARRIRHEDLLAPMTRIIPGKLVVRKSTNPASEQ